MTTMPSHPGPIAVACLLALGATREEADAAFEDVRGVQVAATPEAVLADLRAALERVRA